MEPPSLSLVYLPIYLPFYLPIYLPFTHLSIILHRQAGPSFDLRYNERKEPMRPSEWDSEKQPATSMLLWLRKGERASLPQDKVRMRTS